MTAVFSNLPSWLDVSRETFDKLVAFQALVEKWNPTINLISKNRLVELWDRHILDSAQLIRFCPPETRTWSDLGSGGGFPGLVVAILAEKRFPDLRVTLVESDRRKAVFLSQAIRLLGLQATVETSRIESLQALNSQIVSARALASLSDLLPLVLRHIHPEGVAVFPKGSNAHQEVQEARSSWSFNLEEHDSFTSSEAKILVLRDISHA